MSRRSLVRAVPDPSMGFCAASTRRAHRRYRGALWTALRMTEHQQRLACAAGAAAALVGLLAGCAVGPDFKPPEVAPGTDTARAFSAAPLPASTASAPAPGGAAQQFVGGQDIPALWWQVFHSAPLDELIRSALQRSPSLAAAQAALRQAQEQYTASAGSNLLPNVSGRLGATRERASQANSGAAAGKVFSLYNASVDVSYTVDAFGGIKRELEGLAAAVDYQQYQVEAAYLTLSANLVTGAVQQASLRAQLQATHGVLDAQLQALDVVQKQVALGAVAGVSLLAQQTQVAQTRATLPALENALAQSRHQLAVYAARLPGDAAMPTFDLASLQLPRDLPLSLPSALLRQRPDIRASEALLHEASARVGVATANLYPQITLSGSVGLLSLSLGDLFSGSGLLWSLGAGLAQPIFNGGALQAQQRAAVAAYDQAQAQYQQTVLNAFLNVANVLHALQSDARTLQAQVQAEALARQTLEVVQRQRQLGAVGVLALLEAQRALLQTRIGLAQAQAARYADTAALFQALGGGWWNRDAPPAVPATTQVGAANDTR